MIEDNKEDLLIIDVVYNKKKLNLYDMPGNKRERIFWRH